MIWVRLHLSVHYIICLESVAKWLIISLSIPTPLQALSAGFFYVNVVKMVDQILIVPFVLKIHFLLFIWNMKPLMKNVLLCYLIEPENAIVTIYPRMKNFLKIK